ncbi:hypothetical protein MRB53_041671 [Persea americana]|nr:hypothetical protein MRB53_041671 [Persea americana]
MYWQYIFNILDLVFNSVALATLLAIGPWMLMRARNVPRIVITMALVAFVALAAYIVFDIAVDALFLSTTTDSLIENDNSYKFIQVAPDLEYAFLTISLIFLFVLYLLDSRAAKSGKILKKSSSTLRNIRNHRLADISMLV